MVQVIMDNSGNSKVALSIIVPVYNIEDYVEQAVQSLINQPDYSYEIILVDDGSTDRSGSICDRFKTYDNVKIIHKKNGGLPSARKAGVSIAEGEYISFLDGDDWVDTVYYKNMLDVAKSNDVDIVCGDFIYEFPSGSKVRNKVIPDGLYCGSKLDKLRTRILYTPPYYTYGIFPGLCFKVIRSELIRKYIANVPDDVTVAEDALCTYPIMYNCNTMYVFQNNYGYHYRQHGNSMMRKYDPNKNRKILSAMHCFDNLMQVQYAQYAGQIDMWLLILISNEIFNALKSGLKITAIASELRTFANDKIVRRTLNNMQEDVPFLKRIEFNLLKNGHFILLICLHKFYRSLVKAKL